MPASQEGAFSALVLEQTYLATMFDILVFLFENFFHADLDPDSEQLVLKLSAAGFEDDDICEALQWLDELHETKGNGFPAISATPDSIRCFTEDETGKLDTECRGFLLFLENAGVLSPQTREWVIEQAMMLSEHTVTLPKLKIVVLMVLWKHHQTMDTLILEELLSGNEATCLH